MNDIPKQPNPFRGAAHASALLVEKQRQMQQEQVQKALQEQQEKIQKALIEASSKAFEKAQAYTNVIIIAGYAGAFSLWSSTKAQLPNKANVIIALLLGFSMLVFVLHEIYGMIQRSIHFHKISPLINMQLPSDEKLRRTEAKAELNNNPIWIASLLGTIPTALAAIALLFYSYFAILVGWPLWPS
ncbi:hypothetical protein [Methylocystis sp.]|uniref:hypothetical protein n=1 Tax=Methylocystis sp. TaxID=1911079 RepID=UPI003DA4E9AD